MTSRLASLLVQENLVGAKKMAEAFQRQVIYGGTLDTILLEMDILDEATLLEALGRASALPTAGDLPSLEQLKAADVTRWMPHPMAERFRAVPVGLDGNVLRVLVIDPPDRKQLDELGYTLSLTIDPIIVPEHRFVQAVELVYGLPTPARFASLAAKLRQRAADPNRPRPAAPAPEPVREQRREEPAPWRMPSMTPPRGVEKMARAEPRVIETPAKKAETPGRAAGSAIDTPPRGFETLPRASSTPAARESDAPLRPSETPTWRGAETPAREPSARVIDTPPRGFETLPRASETAARASETVRLNDTMGRVNESAARGVESSRGAQTPARGVERVPAPEQEPDTIVVDERRSDERRTDERRAEEFLAVPERRSAEERRLDERRAVVTDVPMPNARASSAPSMETSELPTARITNRQASAPPAAVTPETVTRISGADHVNASPLPVDEARKAIDEAPDRDAIFESLCRGARARLPFAAILTVHGEIAAGKLALGNGWFDRTSLAGLSVSLDRPSPFRAAAVGRAPYLGRLGEDAQGIEILTHLGRKPPLAALLMPVVLRDRAVAMLYADADGHDLDADVVAELSTLVAAAARSFQRLILRAKGGDYAKAPSSVAAAAKLAGAAHGDEAPTGQWHRVERNNDKPRSAQPRFGVALVNAIKAELMPDAARSPVPPREDAAPAGELHDAPTAPLPDVEGLLISVQRGDEHAQMSADALVAIGERAALALVAHLPGPLRLDRHALRGAPPSLSHHGPLLAVLSRMGKLAKDPLLARLGDASLEVRYYATLALTELKLPETVTPLGSRLYDPDAGVRRAAVDGLARFGDSPPLRALVERLRAELLGPDALRQRYAAEALGVMKDVPSVPRLIELVRHGDPTVVTAARKALVEVTKQDFGTSRWRWRSWWERHRDEPRVEWMLEGLGHNEPEVRLSASEELRGVTSEYFGYAFDLPKREREDARRKWVEWYRENGSRLQDKRS